MGVFHFRNFDVDDHGCGMKICSDSVLLAAWFLSPYKNAKTILDVGTGSGVLALLAADICSQAKIAGVEIDPESYLAAEANFKASPFAERLSAINADIASYEIASVPEIIISNPPYFTNGERSADSARSTARHQDSLSFPLLMSLPLMPGGHLGMVTPADASDIIIFEAEMHRRKLHRLCRVFTACNNTPTRIIWDFCDTDGKYVQEDLYLRDAGGNYSPEYRLLVEPYYQKLPLR